MHNRPINNETDIIRNIFSKSLNEETMEEWKKRMDGYARDADYQTSRQAVERLNRQPTPPAPLAVGQQRPEHLRRLMQDPRNLPYLLRTGQAKISYQNPPAPEPDESGVVNRTYFVPQGVDPSTVNPDKPIRLPTDTAINLARQRIEKQTDVRFSEPSAGYTRPSNLVGIPQQPSLFDMGMQQPAKPKTSEFELGPITSTTPYQSTPAQSKPTPELTANSLIQQMKDIGLFGDQKKTEPNVQPTTSPYETPPELTAPRVAKPTTQPKQTGRWAGPQPDQPVYDSEGDFVGTRKMSEKEGKEKVLSTIRQITAPESQPAATQPKREPIMITKMNASRDYELVPADLSKDEDLLRIQPGSASYGQLTPAEKARRESLANPSKSAPSPSSQTTTGRGRAPSPIPSADSFRAAYNTTGSLFSRPQRPQPAPQPVTSAPQPVTSALDAVARARGEMPPSAARQGWTPETWAAADRQSAELRNRLRATAEPTATTQTATEKPWEQMTPQERFQRGEQIRAQRDVPEMEERARILNIQDPRVRRAAMDRNRAERRIQERGGLPLPPGPYSRPSYTPLNEYYYNTLSEKLDLLEQEEIKGLNIGAYKSRKKAYRTAARLVDPFYTGASGDSSSSGEAEETSTEGPKQPSWGERLKPHIITLMGAAQDHKIELSKEEAVNAGSRDRRRLLGKYKPGSDVHKAARAVDEIMKQFKRAR